MKKVIHFQDMEVKNAAEWKVIAEGAGYFLPFVLSAWGCSRALAGKSSQGLISCQADRKGRIDLYPGFGAHAFHTLHPQTSKVVPLSFLQSSWVGFWGSCWFGSMALWKANELSPGAVVRLGGMMWVRTCMSEIYHNSTLGVLRAKLNNRCESLKTIRTRHDDQ